MDKNNKKIHKKSKKYINYNFGPLGLWDQNRAFSPRPNWKARWVLICKNPVSDLKPLVLRFV
jgi:hypothetical protein